jgi:hypothetical protein
MPATEFEVRSDRIKSAGVMFNLPSCVHAGKIWETLGQLQRRGTRSTYHESGDHPIFGTSWLILNYPEDKKEGHDLRIHMRIAYTLSQADQPGSSHRRGRPIHTFDRGKSRGTVKKEDHPVRTQHSVKGTHS